LLNWIEPRPGDTFFTPAHTVHAIGAGIVLCEIQQNCDITYRLYDYGRPRELHLEQALAVADLGPHPGAVPDGVVRSQHFVTEPLTLRAGEKHGIEARNCHLWICIAGRGSIDGAPVVAGEVWLAEGEAQLSVERESRFLRTYVPDPPA
jgi:mannose-6-phosphate isomerase